VVEGRHRARPRGGDHRRDHHHLEDTLVTALAPCTRCASPVEDGDLRCAICALPVPVAERARDEVVRAKVLRCDWCNAAVAFSTEAQAPRCAFCSSTMKVEYPVDPIETAEVRIPFAVDREAAEEALRGWLGRRGWFAPRTLRDEAVLESLVPLCWAGWIVDARAQVAWTADSDEGSRLSRWAPHAGQVSLAFHSICVPASRGLDPVECHAMVPFYDLSRAVKVDAAIPGEVPAMIESFEAQRSAARAAIQRAIEATAKTRVEPHVPGRRFRNIHVACLLEGQTTRRVALPAWVLAYRYRHAAYRAIVHGQRPGVVFGSSPTDWRKVLSLAGGIALAIAAIVALVLLLSGCGNSTPPPDATDFFDRCEPSGTFAPLTGRAAVQASLNVHVDAGGLIEVDTASKLLLVMDLAQDGTMLSVTSTLCRVTIPDIPLAGQDLPISFQVPDAAVTSVPVTAGTATLATPDQTCTEIDSTPITIIIGARMDPATIETAPLPAADDDGNFVACEPAFTEPCSTATGVNCACDQEGDGNPGVTILGRNVPAIDLDQLYVALRTSFSLHGRVHTSDLVKGRIEATLETGILHCQLIDGTPCSTQNVRLMKTLNPVITLQPQNPSTFRTVRVAADTTCADVLANEGVLFPR
jgi:hypothetical protein